MRSAHKPGRRYGSDRAPDQVDITQGNDPLLTEAPTMVHDDEEEVFDLGFIVDDRDDRRDSLLASWQPLDDLDTDEALETDPTGPLPEEAAWREREGVPASEHPSDARIGTAAAEADEDEFAQDNSLIDDPYASPDVDRFGLDEQTPEEDLDRNDVPEAISIRGRAAGVVRGLGTSLTQDIGAGGFSVQENPLAVPAADPDSPISREGTASKARRPRRPRETAPEPGEKSPEKVPSKPDDRRAPR